MSPAWIGFVCGCFIGGWVAITLMCLLIWSGHIEDATSGRTKGC